MGFLPCLQRSLSLLLGPPQPLGFQLQLLPVAGSHLQEALRVSLLQVGELGLHIKTHITLSLR